MAQRCRAHCRGCHSHFVSVSAFDAHRVFEDPKVHDWDTRVCADLHDDERFVVGAHDGICDVGGGASRQPVPVWDITAGRAAADRVRRWRATQKEVV